MNPLRHWAFVVALLYGLVLAVLTWPVIVVAFVPEMDPLEVVQIYGQLPYWVWIGAMVLSQAAFLVVPVRVDGQRPVPKRSIFLTVLVSGLMFGLLVLAAFLSAGEFIYADKDPQWPFLPSALGVSGGIWVLWMIVFFSMGRKRDAASFVSSQCRYLLKGSILELLIAVPTHIVARHRHYCCAGLMTFVGITLGISVMLFAFGPSVFYLYADRWKRLRPLPPASGVGDS